MTTTVPGSTVAGEFEGLFDALLYAVSHDLKSPLLSIGLGAELLEGGAGADERTRLGLEAIQRGAQDLTRLLDALTLVSRARRRPLDGAPLALGPMLTGVPGLEGMRVAVDPRVIAEFLTALGEAQVRLGDAEVRLVAPLPVGTASVEEPPLEALLGSLGLHAGTVIGTLAVLQVQLERQGGTIVVGAGQATALLPLAGAR